MRERGSEVKIEMDRQIERDGRSEVERKIETDRKIERAGKRCIKRQINRERQTEREREGVGDRE